MPVNPQEAVDLLSDLVRIESVTPWLIPTGSGEGVTLNGGIGGPQAPVPGIDQPKVNPALSLSIRF